MRTSVLLLATSITLALSAPTSTAVGDSTNDSADEPSTVTKHVTRAVTITATVTATSNPHIDPPQNWEKELSRQRQAYPTLPTSIEICSSPLAQNQTTRDDTRSCIKGITRKAGTCLNIFGKGRPNNPDVDNSIDGTILDGGAGAVMFRGSTFCWLFDTEDCFGERIVVKEDEGDDLSGDGEGQSWDGKVRSLACWRKD
ncbi:hypothetical protein EG328_002137 [Venturia inaequalis]|uniref:Ecp2 effector protein domain-containing protein n=1 Tax=Venturia inaequalis TaxID=5025 RepID=A0A8H3UXG2_VENIN|nr:hypothetical protein EG328_002137 [Venturia inaequalis]